MIDTINKTNSISQGPNKNLHTCLSIESDSTAITLTTDETLKTKKESVTKIHEFDKYDRSLDIIIKDLKHENKKLIENQNDSKNILEIFSKSQKITSDYNIGNFVDITKIKGINNLNELDEAKIETKRLKESLEKFKNLLGTSSVLPKTFIPTQHISISSPSGTSISPSSSSNITQKHHRDHQENEKYFSNISNEQQLKKIKTLEESIRELHKSLNNKKQEEAALLTDMEITGQAFEDMQVNKTLIIYSS